MNGNVVTLLRATILSERIFLPCETGGPGDSAACGLAGLCIPFVMGECWYGAIGMFLDSGDMRDALSNLPAGG